MKALLLAGGPPKKLRYVLRSNTSRALLDFPGGTLLDRHLRALRRFFDEVYVVSDDPMVTEKCSSYQACRFIQQRTPGIEGAICDALSLIRERSDMILVDYGDVYFGEGYVESHINTVLRSYEPTITVTKPFLQREQYLRLGVDVITQTVTTVGGDQYIFAGLATLPIATLYTVLCSEGRTVKQLLEQLVSKGGLKANIWLGEWVDIDTPWDYLLAVRLDLAKLKGIHISPNSNVKDTATLEPPVYIGSNTMIDHYAVVKGPVYIGRNVLIGAHSFVRDSTAVFDGATIGAYAEVKRSIVYRRAYISSHCYIADSILGEGAKASPYTVTINVPYSEVSQEIVLTSSHLLEKLKIGAIISAGARTKPYTVLEPASIFEG